MQYFLVILAYKSGLKYVHYFSSFLFVLLLGLNRLLHVKLLKGQLEDITVAVKSTEKNQEQTKQNYEEQVKVHV